MADNTVQSEVNSDPNEVDDRLGDIRAALEGAGAPAGEAVPPAVIPAKESAPADVASVPVVDDLPSSDVTAGAEPTVAAATEADKNLPANWTHWSKADQERFLEQPEGARKIIVDRVRDMEASFTKKTMEIADFKREYGASDEMFTPFKGPLRQAGFTPATAVRAWMAAEQALMDPNRREAAFKALAQNYQIDLGKLAGVSTPQAAPAAVDPANMSEQEQLRAMLAPYIQEAISPYQKKIDELQGNLSKFDQFQASSQSAERSRVEGNIMNEIQTFASAKDGAGNIAHPYFADVEADMTRIMAGYHAMKMAAPTLQEVYDMAVYANPSTRERLSAQQTKAVEEKRQAEARAKAARANRAGSSVTGSPGTGQAFSHSNGEAKDVSVRDSIMAAMEASQ